MTTRIITYNGQPIANTAQLSHGTEVRYLECVVDHRGGVRYLECVVDHRGGLIAKQWRRKPQGEVCIDFSRGEKT